MIPPSQAGVHIGCGKPAFFTERNPLFKVIPESGHLCNTDGGSAMIPIGEADLPTSTINSSAPRFEPGQEHAKVFQGGCTHDLHKMLDIESGDQVHAG